MRLIEEKQPYEHKSVLPGMKLVSRRSEGNHKRLHKWSTQMEKYFFKIIKILIQKPLQLTTFSDHAYLI